MSLSDVAAMSDSGQNLVQWVIDTRKLWQTSEKLSLKEQMVEFKEVATEALSLLTGAEQRAVLKYYHVRDAKMSLVSHLLKHLVITKLCHIPWSESTVSSNEYKKPCYKAKSPEGQTLDFNVSHQAGIVTLIASAGVLADVGTDVVCVNERNDYSFIEKEGFFSWVDLHGDVFAPSEIQFLKFDTAHLALPDQAVLSGYGRDAIARCQHRHQKISWTNSSGELKEIDSNIIVDAKLRRFYALWCLREAYVKMTGEALLADWLRELEFRKVEVPAAVPISFSDDPSMALGKVVTEFEIYFKGKPVTDVDMELRAMGQDYMVASAVRKRSGITQLLPFPGFTSLCVSQDIFPAAKAISP